jgi:hypothetical protein
MNFNQENIMSTLDCIQTVKAGTNTGVAGAKAKRTIISSNARAAAYVFAIIVVVTVAPFVLFSQHFAPNVAKDLRQQSQVLSQAGDQAGAVGASRRAVDIYRGLTRAGGLYMSELAASLHDLSIRLHEAGDDAGALEAIREAVDIRRSLARYDASDAASLEKSLQLLTRIEAASRGELPHTPAAAGAPAFSAIPAMTLGKPQRNTL